MARRSIAKKVERPTFDAKAVAAQCGICPLSIQYNCQPVKPPGGSGKLAVIQDYPTKFESQYGKSMPSSASKVLSKTLANAQAKGVYSTWALLCTPPKEATDAEVEEAVRCCQPRLKHEVDALSTSVPPGEHTWLLAMDKWSFRATTDKSGSPDPWLGSPVTGVTPNTKVIPTWGAGFVLSPKGTRYAKVWSTHVERAAMLSDGRLGAFEWPEDIVDEGSALSETLRNLVVWVEAGNEVSVDIETRGLGLDSPISCIGFAGGNFACCVQLPLSVVDDALVRAILANGNMVGQNVSAFDRQVLRRAGYELTPRYEDTLLAASILDPQIPKNLGALVSAEFHAEAHKAEFKSDKESGVLQGMWDSNDPTIERERRIYCLRDSYTTLLVWQRQKERLASYGWDHYQTLKKLDVIMLRLRESGCEWDFEVAAQLDAKYSAILEVSGRQLKTKALELGIKDFNPGSPAQLAELFFNKMHLAPIKWSEKTGKPSVDEDVLTEFLKADNNAAVEFSRKILEYRSAQKALGTYIRGMVPSGKDNRIFGGWRAHTTPTGRFSCTGRPLQTLNSEMRSLIKATPGKLIVEADLAAAELRTVALFANEKHMLQIFADGGDLYSILARQMFGDPTIAKGHKLRQLGKLTILASNYGAVAETAWTQIVKDETVQKSFPNLTVREVDAVQKKYFAACPRIRKWWDEEGESSAARGYYLEPLSDRRLHFYGAVDRSLCANFPNQAAVAWWMNKALLEIDPQLPLDATILTCVHDAITIEADAENIEKIQKLLHKHMEGAISYQGRSVALPVESKIGTNLAEVK